MLDLESIEKAGGTPAEAVALLALVAGQDVEPAEGSDGTDGRWRIAPDRARPGDLHGRPGHPARAQEPGAASGRVQSPHCHRAGHRAEYRVRGHQGQRSREQRRRCGAALLERDTTIESSTGNSPGAGSKDVEASNTVEVLADSAYGTGDMLARLGKAGHTPVIKPWPSRPAVEGGFIIDDFAYDQDAGTLTCPAGVTRSLSAKRTVTFGVACPGCPLRARCTAATSGRTVNVHKHEQLQREHRARAKDPAFQDTYRTHRPMVERSIAWLVRGNRRVPYRGVAKNNAWLHHRAAALNLRRLLALVLTNNNGAWTLA